MCSIAACTLRLLLMTEISAVYCGCTSGACSSCAASELQFIVRTSANSPAVDLISTDGFPLVCVRQFYDADAATEFNFGAVGFRKSLQIANNFLSELPVRKQRPAAYLS